MIPVERPHHAERHTSRRQTMSTEDSTAAASAASLSSSTTETTEAPRFTSALGRRLWKEHEERKEKPSRQQEQEQQEQQQQQDDMGDDKLVVSPLSPDFLRLYSSTCAQIWNGKTWMWRSIVELENAVVRQRRESHKADDDEEEEGTRWSCVLTRHAVVGLGMTLQQAAPEEAKEEKDAVMVYALVRHDGSKIVDASASPPPKAVMGPAEAAGILPGDLILGVNGQAFSLPPSSSSSSSSVTIGMERLRTTPDPLVLHLQRPNPLSPRRKAARMESPQHLTTTPPAKKNNRPSIHPLAQALWKRKLLKSKQEAELVTIHLQQFMERARRFESLARWREEQAMRGHELSSSLLPPSLSSLPETRADVSVRSLSSTTAACVPSSSSSSSPKRRASQPAVLKFGSYPATRARGRASSFSSPPSPRDVDDPKFVQSFLAVRQSLCIRVVNSFVDGNRMAYTVWVHDVESGTEWYAPVRYYTDFRQLRVVTSRLFDAVQDVPFPASGATSSWLFGTTSTEARGSERAQEERCAQLECFLRTIAAMIYTRRLHVHMPRVAMHLQTFLGCDAYLGGSADVLALDHNVVLNEVSSKSGVGIPEGHDAEQAGVLALLKRCLQQYVYRVFLLPAMEQVTAPFLESVRLAIPTSDEIDASPHHGGSQVVTVGTRYERKQVEACKKAANATLVGMRDFFDHVQTLIHEGCRQDLQSICQHAPFEALAPFLEDEDYVQAVCREAIRSQVELELYVPLRGPLSRQLVGGWRYDDLEMQYKMKALRQRPQSYFNIGPQHQSPSDWRSVTEILRQDVGRMTLPCAKLRAIVEAAKEIVRLFSQESAPLENLGADDFLPIFIFCIVQAQLERPCALCALLGTLCEPSQRIGETGYYLASFEAAITHIQELDLAEGEADAVT